MQDLPSLGWCRTSPLLADAGPPLSADAGPPLSLGWCRTSPLSWLSNILWDELRVFGPLTPWCRLSRCQASVIVEKAALNMEPTTLWFWFHFPQINTQKGDCWVAWWSCCNCRGPSTVSHGGGTSLRPCPQGSCPFSAAVSDLLTVPSWQVGSVSSRLWRVFLWWLMSHFPCICRQFVCLFWKNAFQALRPF